MSKAIIKFDSLADKRITLEFILRELDKKNIKYKVIRQDQLHIVNAERGSDINVFERIMQKVERRGYENFVD
tara:strand:- start:242 stop:457 length:216 start_codon:yes stop_codon:yes gene_type:complete